MDRLKVKKKLYAGLGDFAKQKRGEELRKKYVKDIGGGAMTADDVDRLSRVAASQDEAAEAAHMPTVNQKAMDMSDVPSGADAAGPAIDDAMAAMAEDEEEAKWMAKQRG